MSGDVQLGFMDGSKDAEKDESFGNAEDIIETHRLVPFGGWNGKNLQLSYYNKTFMSCFLILRNIFAKAWPTGNKQND